MANPRAGYVVRLADNGRALVLAERDAATYPGGLGYRETTILAAEGVDVFFEVATGAVAMVFDRAAAQARRELRVAAKAKLSTEEQAACGLSGSE